MINQSAKIEGLDVIFKNLDNLKPAKLNVFIRKGLEKAARVVANATKAGTQPGGRGYDTGALRKAAGFKVGTTKLGRSYAVIGAKRATKRQKGKAPSVTKFGARLKGRQIGRDPANYAHLVEYGHQIAVGGTLTQKHKSKRKDRTGKGTSIGMVMGIGFMRRAYDTTQGPVKQIVKDHLTQAIKKHAASMPGKKRI